MSTGLETRARYSSPWRARLRAAVVRFLVKLTFFSGMVMFGSLGLYWLPDVRTAPCDLDTPPLICIADGGAGICFFIMIMVGISCLALTVTTAGHHPRWN